MTQIILASTSPRRRELMKGLGIKFITDTCEVDESVSEGTSPPDMVRILSLRKAKAVSSKYKEGLVIGSDTIVVLDGIILGKPKDDKDAFLMLYKLQGKKHQVYSGVAIIDARYDKAEVSCEKTDVYFRSMTEEEVYRYIATKEPQGKAGSYAIQGLGSTIVQSIEGDYFNVVGLPLFLLGKMLKGFGVEVF